MNIIYLGAFRFPNQDAASARILNNAKILRLLGHVVKIFSWGGIQREEDLVEGKYVYEGFEYYNTHELRQEKGSILYKLKSYRNRGRMTMSLLRNGPQPDIIIAYNTHYLFNKKCYSFCKKHGIKFVTDITEWYDSNEMGSILSPIFWLSEWNMRCFLKGIPNKILISKFLSQYYNKSNNIILPPLVDLGESKWNVNSRVSPLLIEESDDKKRFIYAGSPAKKDCLGIILEAFLDIIYKYHKKEFQFIILGIERNAKVYHFNQWKLVNSNPSNFIILGKKRQDVIPSYYHHCDFSFIIRKPSKKNNAGFPTKAAESLSAGCPVIFNPTSDLTTYIEHENNGVIIDDYSKESVVAGILKAMSIPTDRLAEMRDNALQTGKEVFDYHNYCDHLKEWIHLLS